MANRDVNLTIKAKEQATKAVDSVADALRELADVQNDVGQSANKTEGLLGKLKAELGALDREARGLAALNKVAGQLDKAAAAVGRLDDAANRAAGDQAKLATSMDAAAKNTVKLRAAADEAKAAYDKQRAAIAALSAEQRKDKAATDAARASRDALKASLNEANAAVKAAERNEGQLRVALANAADAADESRVALAAANDELGNIAALANKASSALGGVEATQAAVAVASARAAGDIERLNAALAQQAGGKAAVATPTSAAGATSAYRQQIAAVNQAKIAWREAQAEANKLAGAIRATEQPTREQQTAFLLAQAASRAAKQEYIAQGVALNTLRGNLSQYAAAQRQANAATAGAAVSGAQAASGVRQAVAATHGASGAFTAAGTQGFRLRDAFKGIYGESRTAMNMFQRMRSEVLSLASAYVGLYAAINGIGTVISTMRAVEQAQNRLGVAFNQNQAVVGSEMRWLEGQADRLKLSFSELAGEYGKFAFSATRAGLSLNDLHTVFLGVAEGARVMGLSSQEVGGILKALDQIMSKGKVQAEELRGQLGDRLSGSFRLFADAIGVTTAELDKMMEQGEVVASRSSMVSFGQKLRDTFGPQLAGALETTTAEIDGFSANLQDAARQVGQGGLWKGLGDALRDMNEWFESEKGEKFFTDIGIALGKLVGLLPQLVQNFDKFVLMFQVFAALKTSQVIMGLMGGFRGLGVQSAVARTQILGLTVGLHALSVTSSGAVARGLGIAAASMTALSGVAIRVTTVVRAMWIAIGGLPGLLITGLVLVISTLTGNWLTAVDRATEAIRKQREVADELTDAYIKAGQGADDWRKSLDGVTQSKIILGLIETEEALESLRKQGFDTFNDTVKTVMSATERATATALRDIVLAFKRGEIGADEYAQQLDAVIAANPEFVRTNRAMVQGLTESAVKAKEGEQSHKWYEAALRAVRGTASEADDALLNLAGSFDAVNESADTTALDAYTAALRKLGEAVPEIKAQMEFTDARADIETRYRAEIDAARALYANEEDTTKFERAYMEAVRKRTLALEALVRQQATSGGGSYIDRLIGAESNGRNDARPIDPATGQRRSSALGGGQFLESTWLNLFKQEFPAMAAGMTNAAILALRTDPEMNRRMVEILTEQNAAMLARAGFAATDTNKYLAHFLGTTDAIDVLRADRSTPVADLVNQRSIAANPEVLGRGQNAGQVIDWAAGRMGVSDAQVQAQQTILTLQERQAKAQRDFNAEIATGVSQRQFEIEQMGRSTTEQAVQVELRRAQTKAMEDGVVFSDQQAADIRASVEASLDATAAERGRLAVIEATTGLLRARGVEQTRAEYIAAGLAEKNVAAESEYGRELAHTLGLTYDVIAAENARKKEQETADSGVANLQAQQQALMEAITFATEQGQMGVVGELQTQLQGVNAELLTAIDAALAFYRALDPATNPSAAAAILGLMNTRNAVAAVGTTAVASGKQINESIANGGAQAFDRFAQAVAEGKNVFESARDAFLQFAADFLREIAQMILKQAILNALGGGKGGGGGVGGAIASAINSLFRHNGGMAGSGGGYKSVWAGHFASATRYHSGGVVGLKPNEVPIIAERGEEVLDAGDPRHRDNGGLGGGAPVNLKNVNLFDIDQLASAILESEVGQKVLINVIGNNARAVSGALGR